MIADIQTFTKKVKKLSPRTRELYGKHLEMFVDWCAGQLVACWDQVDVDLVEAYLEYRSGWADSTRWSGLCAIRKFVKWRFGDSHPVGSITMERKTAPPQRTLNRKQVMELLASFDTSKPRGIRDLAVVTLALDTGLRADELVHVEMDYLDMEQGALFVPVKGGEWEPAAFYEYAKSCLQAWLAVREKIVREGVKTLFVGVGADHKGKPLTRGGLRTIFRKFSKGAGLDLISPHDLRRTFATLAVENGAPTRAVMVAGRWKHIKMVVHYTRALEARVVHRYSPVNQIMGVKPKIEE